MQVARSTRFKKNYRKLAAPIRARADRTILLFCNNPFEPILNNHPLHGEYRDRRSLDVTGDFRIVYREIVPGIALLINIGTHHELYGS